MLKRPKRHKGFTLPEVLVTIAIVAVLAAAVVPTVVSQMSKGEGASVAADVNALAGAVTQFITDTRNYPRFLNDLNSSIAATDSNLLSSQYGARAAAQWNGPYLAANGGAALTNFTFSGFNLVANDTLLVPSSHDGFITLNLAEAGISHAQIIAADVAVDGGDGSFTPNCASPSTGSTTGRLRWTETAATPCTISNLTFRLVPTGG